MRTAELTVASALHSADVRPYDEISTAPELLRAMRGHSTAYELAAIHPDGRRVLVRYTFRRSRAKLYECACRFADELKMLCGTAEIRFDDKASNGATMGEWAIRWTGRTERDALHGGELPFIRGV